VGLGSIKSIAENAAGTLAAEAIKASGVLGAIGTILGASGPTVRPQFEFLQRC